MCLDPLAGGERVDPTPLPGSAGVAYGSGGAVWAETLHVDLRRAEAAVAASTRLVAVVLDLDGRTMVGRPVPVEVVRACKSQTPLAV